LRGDPQAKLEITFNVLRRHSAVALTSPKLFEFGKTSFPFIGNWVPHKADIVEPL
jgi:hypothetical protein